MKADSAVQEYNMAKKTNETSSLKTNSGKKRTSIGKSKNCKPKSKNAKKSFKAYRGQG